VSRSPGRKRSGVAHWQLEAHHATPSIVGPTGEGGEGKKSEGVMAGPTCYWQKCRKCSSMASRWRRVWLMGLAMTMALEEARAELVQEEARKEAACEEMEKGLEEGRRAP